MFIKKLLAASVLFASTLTANANVFYDISAAYESGGYSGYINGTPLTGYIELLSNADGSYGSSFGPTPFDYPLLSNIVSWSFTDGTTTNSSTNDSLDGFSSELNIFGGNINNGYLFSTDFSVGSNFSTSGQRSVYFSDATFTLRSTPQEPTASVPEPETYGMMLLGLGLLGFVARRKQA